MADILCPICNRVNDSNAERCWYCQAKLPGGQPSSSDNGIEQTVNDAGYVNQALSKGNWKDVAVPSDEKGEEEVPDWLARIRELEHGSHEDHEEPHPFTDERHENDVLPDWLNDLRSDAAADTPPTSEMVSSASEDLTKEQSLPQFQGKNPPQDETSDTFDTFLAELGIGKGKARKFSSLPAAEMDAAPSDDIEAKDGSIDRLIGEIKKDEFFPASAREEPIKDDRAQSEPAAENHDQSALNAFPWESGENREENIEPEPEPLATEPPVSEDEQLPVLPTLSGEFGSIPPIEINPESLAFANDDLPDWLSADLSVSEEKIEKPTAVKPEQETPPSGKLERAQLPAWLHAIRPVESMMPLGSEASPKVEEEKGEGILSGIEGVLHSSDLSTQITKPHVHISGLEVSQQQQKNASLFASLFEETAKEPALEVPGKQQSRGSTILRTLITLLILAAVIVPFFSSVPLGIIPVLFPSEVVNAFSEIQALPAGKPVLVAAHFEAGLAGELGWVSHPILEHLLARNVPMVVISTNSIGSAVLDGKIQEAASSQPGYSLSDQYLNLGYLPGGTLGILSLTRDLRQTVPYSADLQPAWQKLAFQNIYQFSDFGAVIVLTDNGDFAKSWVEQMGIIPNNPPILAVVSAQASPMAQPYYDSGQIKGFVAGMNGSLAYEQIMQRSSSATEDFSSFQIALLIVAIVIFLGGAVTLILPSSQGSNKEGGK